MDFFIEMEPPTVTAQMRRVTVKDGKPMFYKSRELKAARSLFIGELLQHKPEYPIEGPIRLHVTWMFPTKSHKTGEWRITRPDTDNLQKMLKDCMTDVGFWHDDAQVCVECVGKLWTRVRPGIQIKVERIEKE